MLNTKEYFKQLEAIPAVNELDDEIAAAIQGGYDLQVYRHAGLRDLLGEFNFGKDRLSSNADNQITSIKVNAGRWRLFDRPNYGGDYVEYRQAGSYNLPSWFNDRTSSLRRF